MPWAVLLVNTAVTLLISSLVVRVVLTNVVLLSARDRLGPTLRALNRFLTEITEPVLSPIRRVLPATRLRIDLAPLVAIIALDLIGRLLVQALLRVF